MTYPGYADGYGGYPGYADGYGGGTGAPAGPVDAAVAAPAAVVTVRARQGVLHTSVVVAGPVGMFGTTAWPGTVSTTSFVPITASLAGPTTAVAVSALVGGVAATVSSTPQMVEGVPATVVVGSPDGWVSVGSSQGLSPTQISPVEPRTAPTVVVSAPPGVLTTSPPNLAGPTARTTVASPVGAVAAYVVDTSADVLSLAVIDTVLPVQPGLLRVAVTNGEPSSVVNLFLADPTTPVGTVTLDESGSAVAALSVSGVAQGDYQVSVDTAALLAGRTWQNTGDFHVAGEYVAQAAAVLLAQPPAMPPEAPVNHWVFQPYDLSGPVRDFTLPVNPTNYAPVFGGYNITSEATTSGDHTINWEGQVQPQPMRFSGHVLDKTQYLAMRQLADTSQRFWVTDHLRQRRLVKITALGFQRIRDRARPWHHTYEAEAVLLSEVTV